MSALHGSEPMPNCPCYPQKCTCDWETIGKLLDEATPDTWPQGILAAAELREKRASCVPAHYGDPDEYGAADRIAEHIAAESNPAHALTAVRRWRGVVERHKRGLGKYDWCATCVDQDGPHGAGRWPCPDLTETADEARAYLGGAS